MAKDKQRGANPMLGFLRSVVPIFMTFAVLIGWAYLTWQTVQDAPGGAVSRGVTVARTSAPYILGWEDLGQRPGPRSAETQHLQVRNADGKWAFVNLAARRRVLLTTADGNSRFIHRWKIQLGDRISFNEAEIEVVGLRPDRITLRERNSSREFTWDGSPNPKGEEVTKVCENVLRRSLNGAKWMTRNWFSNSDNEIGLFTIGGGVNCSNRWRMFSRLARCALRCCWALSRAMRSQRARSPRTWCRTVTCWPFAPVSASASASASSKASDTTTSAGISTPTPLPK